MADTDLIAAFLANRGATACEPSPAYGVDPAADRQRRAEARERREYEDAERRAERAAEAFASGDREAGYAELSGYERTAPGHYRRVRLDRF